jgi:hypothetical protein
MLYTIGRQPHGTPLPPPASRSLGACVAVRELAAPDSVRVSIFWRGLAVRSGCAGGLPVHLHDQQLPTRRQRFKVLCSADKHILLRETLTTCRPFLPMPVAIE